MKPRLLVIAPVSALVLAAALSFADDAAPAPAPVPLTLPPLALSVETLAGTTSTPGGTQASLGARAVLLIGITSRFTVPCRLDGWRQGDGQPSDVNPTNWSSFQAFEVHCGLDVEIAGGIAAFAAVGEGAPAFGADPAVSNPVTAIAGVRLGSFSAPRSLRVGFGRYDGIGSKRAAVVSVRLRLTGPASFLVDGARDMTPGRTPHWIFRTAVAVKVL